MSGRLNVAAPFSILKIWGLVLAGAPVWWLLGLNLVIYHAAALLLFLMMLQWTYKETRTVVLPFPVLLLGGVAGIYFFSLLVHMPQADSSRIAASLYNLSFWVMGLLLVLALANDPGPLKPRFWSGICAGTGFFTGFCALGMLFLSLRGVTDMTFSSPLYFLTHYLGHTILIENTLVIQPIYRDWVDAGLQSRLNVLSPYPTASGGVLLMLLFMIRGWTSLQSGRYRVLGALLMAVNFAALYLTLSRIAIAALLLGFFFVALIEKKRIFLWIFCAGLLLLLALPWLVQLVDWILRWREGSTLGRLALYRYSLQQLSGLDWLIGLGLKPRVESAFAMPIGSHSTYLSLVVKTGIAGAMAFVLFQFHLFLRWYGLKEYVTGHREREMIWKTLGRIFVAMGFWMVTQDLDAPQLVCFLYFSAVGILEKFRRELACGLS